MSERHTQNHTLLNRTNLLNQPFAVSKKNKNTRTSSATTSEAGEFHSVSSPLVSARLRSTPPTSKLTLFSTQIRFVAVSVDLPSPIKLLTAPGLHRAVPRLSQNFVDVGNADKLSLLVSSVMDSLRADQRKKINVDVEAKKVSGLYSYTHMHMHMYLTLTQPYFPR